MSFRVELPDMPNISRLLNEIAGPARVRAAKSSAPVGAETPSGRTTGAPVRTRKTAAGVSPSPAPSRSEEDYPSRWLSPTERARRAGKSLASVWGRDS